MAFQNHSECLSTFQKFKGGVMDIKNFETAYLNAGGKSSELEKEDGEYVSSKSQMGWQMWLAAKAQAVPNAQQALHDRLLVKSIREHVESHISEISVNDLFDKGWLAAMGCIQNNIDMLELQEPAND